MLLPLAAEPFNVPTDRDMLPSERRRFVETHRTCVLAYARRADGPAQSVVYYVPTDDGDLLVATMQDRAKAKAVARLGKVSLLVLDEQWPSVRGPDGQGRGPGGAALPPLRELRHATTAPPPQRPGGAHHPLALGIAALGRRGPDLRGHRR